MATSGGGSVSPTSGTHEYVYNCGVGQTVSISAAPSSGYEFSGWTGSGTGNYTGDSPDTSVTLNNYNNVQETANFAPTEVSTIFSETGLPSLTTAWSVTYDGQTQQSSLSGGCGDCVGYFYTTPGSYPFSVPSVSVPQSNGCTTTYTPSPSSGNFQAGGDENIVFSPSTTCPLTITTDMPSCSSSCTISPSIGTYYYPYGTVVDLSESASGSYKTDGWTGSGTGSYTGYGSSAASGTVTMDGAITESANFYAYVVLDISYANTGMYLEPSGAWTAVVNYNSEECYVASEPLNAPGTWVSLWCAPSNIYFSETTQPGIAWCGWTDGGYGYSGGDDTTPSIYVNQPVTETAEFGYLIC